MRKFIFHFEIHLVDFKSKPLYSMVKLKEITSLSEKQEKLLDKEYRHIHSLNY